MAATLLLAPSTSAGQTIGPDVAQTPITWGTCGFNDPARRPCMIITTALPAGRLLTAPCAGTITRFRLNGFPRPANHYRLRVIRKNPDGSYTGTATSDQVAIANDGVNEYATNLPIAAGEYIGIDFQDSTEDFGLRWVGTFPSNSELYFYAFPADGGSASPTGPDPAYYLFNADVLCDSEKAPVSTVPSNEFKILGLKGKVLSLDLASAGAVRVSEASARQTLARTSKKGKGLLPTKSKWLKPISASGGPGEIKLNLKLTAAAKKKLLEKGKVKVKALIAFTPSGGTTATQTKQLTIKKRKPRKAKGGK